MDENDKSAWFPVSMITSEARAEEIKRKQKAKTNIARMKKKKKKKIMEKRSCPHHLVIPRKITSTKIRIACLTNKKFSKMKKTFSTTFAKQLLNKMSKD